MALLSLLLYSNSSQSQPIAAFDIDHINTTTYADCSPFTVQFDDQSLGNIVEYRWLFGNGSTSDLENPLATYVSPGVYDVALEVFDGTTWDTVIKPSFITVFENPEAALGIIGPDEGCVPFSVTFEDQTILGDTTIASWLWDFGDGNTGTDSMPTHIYNLPFDQGYDVTVVVTDHNGCESTVKVNELITTYQPPVSNFNGQDLFSCTLPHSIDFMQVASGAAPIQFDWDFGDGSTSSAENPTHTYTQAGNYDVQLVVTDITGCSDTLVRPAYVQIQGFTASFTVEDTSVCIGQLNKFDDNSAPQATSWSWKLGDGRKSTGSGFTISYADTGKYVVELIASNALCADTVRQTIHVPVVKSYFHADTLVQSALPNPYTASCMLPFTVNFTDTSISDSMVTSWLWDFGDGNTSTDQHPTHTYSTEDTFDVSLTITNGDGCLATLEYNNYVWIELPEAKIQPVPNEGCVPLTVEFFDISTAPFFTTINQWQWDFGDGSPVDNGQNVSHIYTEVGIYTASLVVTTIHGCTDTATTQIRVGGPPTSEFTATPLQACVKDTIDFTELATDELAWIWIFEGGTPGTSGSPNPKVIYHVPGTYDVTLIADSMGCKDTLTKFDYIQIDSPAAFFQINRNCQDLFSINFQNTSMGEDPGTWFWDFDDGTTSTAESPAHLFPDTGIYNVSLAVNRASTGCFDTITIPLTITEPIAAIAASDTSGCFPLNDIQFSAGMSSGMSLFANFGGTFSKDYYGWDFGNGEEYYTSNINDTLSPLQSYDSVGTYTISLRIADDKEAALISYYPHRFARMGCIDTATFDITVTGPKAGFMRNTIQPCVALQFSFSDTSSVIGGTLNQWFWDFGDGQKSTSQDPTHAYNSQGSYTIKLRVQDDNGCADSIEQSYDMPLADFMAADTIVCAAENLQLTNNSSGLDLTYIWDFGDGDTSHSESPTHAYSNGGFFNIGLTATDAYGCSDSVGRSNHIYVQNPVADFTADATSANCPPLETNFSYISNGENIIQWNWDFGDNGGPSNLMDPSRIYDTPGDYSVRLIVTSSEGCMDTLIRTDYIHVGGPYAELVYDADTGCYPFERIFVIQNKADVATFTLDFGDGSSSQAFFNPNGNDTISHTYNTYGVFYPILALSNGQPGNLACEFSVVSEEPVVTDTIQAIFTTTQPFGCVPVTVQVQDSSFHANSWVWDFGDGSDTIAHVDPGAHTYEQAGTYDLSLVVANNIPCFDTLTIPITVHPIPELEALGDSLICRDDSAPLSTTNSSLDHKWYPPVGLDFDTIPNPTATPDSSITYFVYGVDNNGCISDTDSVHVRVQQEMNAHSKPTDTAIIAGDQIVIATTTDQEVQTYSWTPSQGLSCTDCPNPTVNILETTTYTISMIDTSSCFENELSIVVEIRDDYTLDVPQAFTPNGDGNNDIIYVRGWGIEELLEFKIFNRWGELVFESNDMNIGWDGTYRGVMQNMDSYVYYARARPYNTTLEIERKGSFSLIR